MKQEEYWNRVSEKKGIYYALSGRGIFKICEKG